VNGNVKLGHAAACSGECAQHFSNASCLKINYILVVLHFDALPVCDRNMTFGDVH